MPRPVGSPKTGGRRKGTPNRRSGQLADKLDALGIDVLAEIAKALPDLDTKARVETLMALMSFLYPKRKAIEHPSADEEMPRTIAVHFVKSER